MISKTTSTNKKISNVNKLEVFEILIQEGV
jgi:hypothetical protein